MGPGCSAWGPSKRVVRCAIWMADPNQLLLLLETATMAPSHSVVFRQPHQKHRPVPRQSLCPDCKSTDTVLPVKHGICIHTHFAGSLRHLPATPPVLRQASTMEEFKPRNLPNGLRLELSEASPQQNGGEGLPSGQNSPETPSRHQRRLFPRQQEMMAAETVSGRGRRELN